MSILLIRAIVNSHFNWVQTLEAAERELALVFVWPCGVLGQGTDLGGNDTKGFQPGQVLAPGRAAPGTSTHVRCLAGCSFRLALCNMLPGSPAVPRLPFQLSSKPAKPAGEEKVPTACSVFP